MLVSDVNLVKLFARSIERLQRGEVGRLRLVGFTDANPERRALAHGLIEDHRHGLGPEIVTLALPGGGFEIAGTAPVGEVIEIDISEAIPD